jgi:HD-like signal output (HDOD) protein/CheY-like chemotaxis protein
MSLGTILLVDGKSIFRDLLAPLLEKHGYQTALAVNGAEALGRLREEKVDLILLDVELPGMTGVEFLQRLRQLGCHAPVIVLTDVRDKNVVIRAAALGVRDYVLKSCFSADRLLERIRQLLLAPAPAEHAAPAAHATLAPSVSMPPAPIPPARQATVMPPKTPGDPPAAETVKSGIASVPRILSREKTIQRLETVTGGKTIAGVVAQVIAVASSPKADLSDVVRVIQGDPILASRVLHLANSAATGARNRVGSIEDAARVIGVRGIQNMAISIGIFSAFPPNEADGFNSMRCWQHSFAVAELMGLIARQRNPEQESFNHLLGLCHELGEILLRQHFMAEYDQIVELSVKLNLPLYQVESAALGIRRPELMSRLLSRIGLPPHVVDTIREFHERQIRDNSSGMSGNVQLLQMANMAAHGMLLAPSMREIVRPITRTEWRALGIDKDPPEIDALARRNDIVVATHTLARLPVRQEDRLLEPFVQRTPLHVGYVRPELYINLDPLAFALHMMAEMDIFKELPQPEELRDLDALVVVALRPGVSPAVPTDLRHYCADAGCAKMPILLLTGQVGTVPPAKGVMVRTYPLRLDELHDWVCTTEAMKEESKELVA